MCSESTALSDKEIKKKVIEGWHITINSKISARCLKTKHKKQNKNNKNKHQGFTFWLFAIEFVTILTLVYKYSFSK